MKKIGVDDAGRGPVIGPMILCGVLIEDEREEDNLKILGAKDSKLLTKKNRFLLSEKIKEDYKSHVEVTEPEEIDNFPNLNNLEAIKCGIIINSLMKDIDEKVKVVVDCPSSNASSWSEMLRSTLIKKDKAVLVCEHKADFNHPVVSAASIIAKEKREEILRELKKELNDDFGSGYPSDPRTRDFLVRTFGEKKFDKIIRKSWNTYKKISKRFGQDKLFYL